MNTIRNRLILGLAFGILVSIGLAFWSDLGQLQAALITFHWEYFIMALGCTLFNYFLRGVKWHYYIRRIGATQISFPQSFRLFVAGFPLAMTPGKTGEALKAYWLSEWTGVPFARGLPVVFAERLSDGIAVLILSILGVISFPVVWPAFAAISTAALLLIVIIQYRPLAMLLLRFSERLPLIGGKIHAFRDFYEAGYTLLQPAPLGIAVSLGVVSWMGEGLGFYFLLLGMGIAPSLTALGNAIFALAFSTIIGAASALPGGLGAVEASLTGLLLLTSTGDSTQAGAATLLIRLATLWFGVALGLLTWLFTPSLWFRPEPPSSEGDSHVES